MNNLIDPNRTYHLPESIGLMLGSGRGELASVAIRQIREGTLKVDEALAIEMVALIANLVNDLGETKRKLSLIELCVNDLLDDMDEVRGKTLKVSKAAREISDVINDNPIEEDE